MEKQKKGMSAGAMIGIGASIAATVAAGYLLFGPDGKKNRKTVKGWAVKMKGEIIEKFEEAKELTESTYHSIVDEVAARYATAKNVDKAELAALVADIRKHWKVIAGAKKPKMAKKKTTHSSSKKGAKKTTTHKK